MTKSFCLVLATIALSASASASTITAPLTFSNVSGSGSVVTPDPNNNNVPVNGSQNLFQIVESVNSSSLLAPYWMVGFSTPFSGGSTEYNVVKVVQNNSGSTWNSFRMFFGAGNIDNPNPQLSNTGVLTFDSDSSVVLSGTGTTSATVDGLGPNYIAWGNLSIPTGDSITIEFTVDTCAGCSGGWGIQQDTDPSPVPEPGTFAVVALGAFGFLLRKHRRAAAALACALLGLTSASASTITDPISFSNITGSGFTNTVVVNNNNAPGGTSPNTITLNEVATQTGVNLLVNFNVTPVEPGFPSNLSTEYAVEKIVTNNSSDTWTSFAMTLNTFFLAGVGLPGNASVVAFDGDSSPVLSGSGVSGQIQTLLNSTSVAWGNLNVLPGDTFTIKFSVDTCATCTGIWQIAQLAEATQVPEPATYALIGLSLVALRLRKEFYR